MMRKSKFKVFTFHCSMCPERVSLGGPIMDVVQGSRIIGKAGWKIMRHMEDPSKLPHPREGTKKMFGFGQFCPECSALIMAEEPIEAVTIENPVELC